MKKVVSITRGYKRIHPFLFHKCSVERFLFVGTKFHFTESTISQKTSLNSSNEHLDKKTVATKEDPQ